MHFLRNLLGSFILFSTTASFAVITANDPTESPVYGYIDRLEAYGCAAPSFRALRPQARGELTEAVSLPDDESSPCLAPERLLKEREILKRPVPNEARLLGVTYEEDPLPLNGIDATVIPLFPNRYGRKVYSGGNLYGEAFANTQAGNEVGIALSATAGFLLGAADYENINGRFYLNEGYGKIGYKRAELTLGRVGLGFGEAVHGNLLFASSAKPLNLVKFAVRPHVLATPFNFLGPLTFEVWSATNDSVFPSGVPNSRLVGMAVGLRPLTILEVAFMEILQFGGTQAPSFKTSEVMSSLFFLDSDDVAAKRQKTMAMSIGIWGPSHFVKWYGQFLFEGLSTFSFSSEISTVMGLWFPKVGAGELRLEYVHTTPNAYQNTFWRQGLTYQGSPLGHPIGPNGEGFYVDIGLPSVMDWRPLLSASYEVRGRTPGTGPNKSPEYRLSGGVEAQRRWLRTELGLSAKYASVNNSAYQADESDQVFGATGIVRYSFF